MHVNGSLSWPYTLRIHAARVSYCAERKTGQSPVHVNGAAYFTH
jgi:hypothetical protein